MKTKLNKKDAIVFLVISLFLLTTIIVPHQSIAMSGSPKNAMWVEHVDTDFLDLTAGQQEAIVDNWVLCGVDIVFLQVGNWHSEAGVPVSINQWGGTATDFTNFITAVDTYSSSTIDVYAWMIWSGPAVDGGLKVDLTSSSTRAAAVSLAVDFCNDNNFDGFNDDLFEGYTGADSYYVLYANALATALHANTPRLGATCDLEALYATDYATLYGGITEMDYLCPMFYDSEAWEHNWLDDTLALVLANTNCEILAGIVSFVDAGSRNINLLDQLTWLGHPTSTYFAGVSVWSLQYMTDFSATDWTDLASWHGSTTSDFSDGFESGDTSAWTADWTSSGSVAVQSTIKHTGNYALNATATASTNAWGRVYYEFPSNQTTYYAQAMVYFTTLPANGQYMEVSPGLYTSTGSTTLSDLRIYNNSGTYQWALRYYQDSGSTYATSSTPSIAINTWYCTEVMMTIDASAGMAKAWVAADGGTFTEGSPTISATSLANDNAGAIRWVGVGTYVTSTFASKVYIDELTTSSSFIATGAPAPTATPTPTPVMPTATPNTIIVSTSNTVFFFRDDSFTVNNNTAYGLDPINTATGTQASSALTAVGGNQTTFSARVYKVTSTGVETELTTGYSDITVTRTADGSGYQNATWNCPLTTLSTGQDALKVKIYLSQNNQSTYTLRATFITDKLPYSALTAQTWTFSLYTLRTSNLSSVVSFYWGSSVTYQSHISGIGFTSPTPTQLLTAYFLSGEYILFFLTAYTAQIGVAAYLMFVLIPCVALYLRHRNFGPVLMLFAIFGGSGGAIYLFIPGWAALVVYVFLALGFAFTLWKLIR